MKHIFEETVYYADTDCYGVVWHGTYLRWMEKGRVELCRQLGLDLVALKENDILMPVTNMNVRFKSSAKLDEQIVVETRISKVSPLTIVFSQEIKNKNTNKTYILADFEVVAVNSESKLYRKMPEILKLACDKALKE